MEEKEKEKENKNKKEKKNIFIFDEFFNLNEIEKPKEVMNTLTTGCNHKMLIL